MGATVMEDDTPMTVTEVPSNVVTLQTPTRLDIPVERIIAATVEANLSEVVVIGFDADGEFYFGSSKADGGDVLWLLALAKKRLMEIGDPD